VTYWQTKNIGMEFVAIHHTELKQIQLNKLNY